MCIYYIYVKYIYIINIKKVVIGLSLQDHFLGHQQHCLSNSTLLEYAEWVHKSCMLGKYTPTPPPTPSWVTGPTLSGAAATKDFP